MTLKSKSWVANEFLDMMCNFDLLDNSLEKLTFIRFDRSCEPFEEEVMSRLANICSRLSHLQINSMFDLSEAGRLSMVSLLRQIMQNNPQI